MTQPIRVLQVFSILNRGGGETMIMNYYRHIDRSRVQFDFLVHREQPGAYEEEITALGGRIFRIPPITSPVRHARAVRAFFDEHPEFRIIHGHVSELGYFIYREAAKRYVPCIIAHAHNAECSLDLKWPFRALLKRLIRPHISCCMTCGHDAARWLFGKKLAASALMLNNAVDAQAYRFSDARRQAEREKMGWQNHWVIGNVARFSPQKNHHLLIKLFSRVLQRRPDALLVLVGDTQGDTYEAVEGQVEKLGLTQHVQFLGSRNDVHDLLQGMDVYCAPSLYEGLSVSMVEAQAAGLHVITSTGVPEEVRLMPNSVSFLSLNESVEHWVERLLSPYERKDTYAEICQAGFDIVENARRLQQFYLAQASTKD